MIDCNCSRGLLAVRGPTTGCDPASWPSPVIRRSDPGRERRQRVIGLFPDWYVAVQPDWPRQTSRLSPVRRSGKRPLRSIMTPVGSWRQRVIGLFPELVRGGAARLAAADEPRPASPCDAGEAAPPWHRATIGPAMCAGSTNGVDHGRAIFLPGPGMLPQHQEPRDLPAGRGARPTDRRDDDRCDQPSRCATVWRRRSACATRTRWQRSFTPSDSVAPPAWGRDRPRSSTGTTSMTSGDCRSDRRHVGESWRSCSPNRMRRVTNARSRWHWPRRMSAVALLETTMVIAGEKPGRTQADDL